MHLLGFLVLTFTSKPQYREINVLEGFPATVFARNPQPLFRKYGQNEFQDN